MPAKDLVFGFAWAWGLVRSDVDWRGNRLRVLPGTRIDPESLPLLARGLPAAQGEIARA